MTSKKIVSVDFDGVLHQYSGWKGATVIDGLPVEGALEWLLSLVRDERFEVHVFSSRSGEPEGIIAMADWLYEALEHRWGSSAALLTVTKVWWPHSKPPAHVSIDDRGYRFMGPDAGWPDPDVLANHCDPWWKPPVSGLNKGNENNAE